jgi:hypothetical protein
MQVNGQGYVKPGRAALLLGLVVLLALTSVARANSLVKDSGPLQFAMESKPFADGYLAPEQIITMGWQKNVPDQQRSTISYYSTELINNATGRVIEPRLIEVKTIYDSAYQALDGGVVFLQPGEDQVPLVFRLSSRAWGAAGTYVGWLKSPQLGNSGDIRVVVKIKKYICLDVDRDTIEIHADRGPGIYTSAEPIVATVTANHRDWILNVSGEPLDYDGADSGESPQIPLENISVTWEQDGELHEGSMEPPGIIFSGQSTFWGTMFELTVKGKIDWQHIAGTYKGKVKFTLSEGDSNPDQEIDSGGN